MLFDGSVVDNLWFGCLDVSDVDMIVVVCVVNVYDFILVLFDGYVMCIGECGFMLLGG